jgi:putative aldouronate transport system substrate-binding protein
MDMFGAFGVVESQNGTWLSVTNGKVQYIAAQDGFLDAISYFHRLYAEGLIDQEVFTQDWGIWGAKTNPPNDQPEIVGVAPHWNRSGAFGLVRVEHYSLLMPLKGPKGDQLWRQNAETTQGAKYALEITSSNKNPEIAFRWADAVYDEIVGLEMYYGAIGLVLKENSDGTYEVNEAPPGLEDQWIWGNSLNGNRPGYTSDAMSARVIDEDQNLQIVDKQRLSAYYPKEYFPLVSLTPEEQNELSLVRTDIHSYAKEQAATWIVSGGVEREYAGFVSRLETMGLKRMLEIYQAGYDRYVGK